jgi:hypothetical protein
MGCVNLSNYQLCSAAISNGYLPWNGPVSEGMKMMHSKDIFPLGCYDHKFSDPSNFPLCFFLTSCAQSHLTTLLVKHVDQFQELRESSESDCE